MEDGAAAFLRVKVCLIHVTTSREVRKEKQTFTASTWPPRHTVPITPVVFLHHERSGSLTGSFSFGFYSFLQRSWQSFEWEKAWR